MTPQQHSVPHQLFSRCILMCVCEGIHIPIPAAVKNSIKERLMCQQKHHESTITIGALRVPSKEIQAIRERFYPLKEALEMGFLLDLCAGRGNVPLNYRVLREARATEIVLRSMSVSLLHWTLLSLLQTSEFKCGKINFIFFLLRAPAQWLLQTLHVYPTTLLFISSSVVPTIIAFGPCPSPPFCFFVVCSSFYWFQQTTLKTSVAARPLKPSLYR